MNPQFFCRQQVIQKYTNFVPYVVLAALLSSTQQPFLLLSLLNHAGAATFPCDDFTAILDDDYSLQIT